MNAMMVLFPYKYEDMWVFDDPDAGLHREPFVLGIDDMITQVVAKVPNAEKGFLGYCFQLNLFRAIGLN